MNFNADQLIAAQQSTVKTVANLSEKTFAGFEKLVELNLAASKAMMGDAFGNLQVLGEAKDLQALQALQTTLAQSLKENTASYNRHLYEIVSGTGAAFTSVFEAQTAQSQNAVTSLLKNSLKNAPSGSDAAVAVFKSAIDASNNAMEAAQKAAKQAVQMVESNINAATAA